MTKETLLKTIEAHAENIRLVNIMRVLVLRGDFQAIDKEIFYNDALIKAYDLLNDQEKLIHTTQQLYLTALRAAVTESFELTRFYAKQNNQEKLLKQQKWFHVIRIIRNSLNHNFIITYKPFDTTILPLRWDILTLDISLENKELTQNIFPPSLALEWLECLEEFIEKELI